MAQVSLVSVRAGEAIGQQVAGVDMGHLVWKCMMQPTCQRGDNTTGTEDTVCGMDNVDGVRVRQKSDVSEGRQGSVSDAEYEAVVSVRQARANDGVVSRL
jgi:hypothetical protein